MQPDVGDSGRFPTDTFWARSAFVGLETPSLGRVTLGRNTAPYFLATILFNPLVDSFVVGPMITHTFRGALQGVDAGQVEAARALGLSPLRIFVHVRLPQMWRLALPGLGNHMNSIIKDTSLLSVIGVEEITYTAEMATTLTGQPFTMYLVVALIYLAMTSLVVASVARLERRANRHLAVAR